MPIYAYRCEACDFAKDVLQKISDAQLTDCPSCGKSSFKKQVTAAGFQLKGTGWYATDFRGGASAKSTNGAASGAAPAKDAGETGKSTADAAAPAAAVPATGNTTPSAV